MVKRPSAVDLWPDDPADSIPRLTEPSVQVPVPQPRIPAPDQDEDEDEDNENDESDNDPAESQAKQRDLNPTCVTPLVAALAKTIYRDLLVAGDPITSVDTVLKSNFVSNPEYIDFMDRLLELVHAMPFDPVFDDRYRLARRSHQNYYSYYRAVTVNIILYQVNDVVIVPAGEDGQHPVPYYPAQAPRTRPFAFAGDLFWFGRILSIKRETRTAHVQWFQHGAKTMLEELAHPQELFFTDMCGDVNIASFLARCQCRKVSPGDRPGSRSNDTIGHTEFFYSLSYIQEDVIFRDISEVEDDPGKFVRRIGACGLCAAREKDLIRKNEDCSRLPPGEDVGFERSGIACHVYDVVLIKEEQSGPCLIGQITSIDELAEGFRLTLQVFERFNDITRVGDNVEADQYEERHLFLTDRKVSVHSDRLISKAFVLVKRSAKKLRLRGWLESDPNHFYITKTAPSKDRASLGIMSPVASEEFYLCEPCVREEIDKTFDFLSWKENMKVHPLRIFDPFGGCGAFAMGVCDAGNMKFTHAVEKIMSAAATIRLNSPDTIVYNQCANKMLEYAVSRANGSNMTLNDLLTSEALPAPPQREEIDCILSGFPCQPHSRMNRYPRATDLVNELYLNTISWVEHLCPKYCLFENVPGFMQHRIGATQIDQHTIQGGIIQGGIKLTCRALTALGYQVRFATLQAAHYGTPQRRRRFFLWAARTGLPLPGLPPRTHEYPATKSLAIRCSNGDVAGSVSCETGTAPMPMVTVADSISDLKRWDWENPHKEYKETAHDRREREARRHIVQVRSHPGDGGCGIGGVEYEHEPRTAYQARCRRRPASELQHVTYCFNDVTIEATVNVPLEGGSSFKDLNHKPKLWKERVDPLSANARHGYKTPMFVRLEADKCFNTIVTNIGPTAKQSKLLNPWCKRLVTVRELARSQGFPDAFEFKALDRKIKTMHAMIGNAVPWPLSVALGRELERAWYKETARAEVDNDDDEMEC